LVLLGCGEVYADVPPLVKRLLGINVSTSQVYRTCQQAASQIEEDELSQPSENLAKVLDDPDATIYGMMDGSMIFTDDGWQETKVGRVFVDVPVERMGRPELEGSEYVVHRGHYAAFTKKFEKLFPPESICRKVFITDGASWIGNWLAGAYPNELTILDYWHVVDKLAGAARLADAPRGWLDKQKERLLSGFASEVAVAVGALGKLAEAEKKTLVGYIRNNQYRMKYDEYRSQGLRIGSGAIEAAHKTVLQVRMKRSGQRWCDNGADNMMKLRAAYKSGKFNLIADVFRTAA
jgi:hypothetical protein